jgi:superfamily II DNA or RNA helicase
MTRKDIQLNAVDLSSMYNNLLLSWCTGLGKSKAALDAVGKLKGRGYIVLSEKSHKSNWYEEILKHNHREILGRSTVFLYASLHKYINTEVDWIIWDEIHHGLSDLRQEHISSIKSNHNIFLTATLEKNQLFDLNRLFKNVHKYEITLEEAIDWKILPEPEINLIPIRLSDSGYSESFVINKGNEKKRIKLECNFNERWGILKQYKDLELTVKCTQSQKYSWLGESIEYWKKQYFKLSAEWAKFKWLNYASQRKRFLAEIKTPYANEIILQLERDKRRYICFAGSINQSEILGSHNNVVHSLNKNNQDIINNFNSKNISSLFAVNMLQEGVNLRDVEIGVIVQLDSKLRSYTQRAGRIFRANKPIQYILYVKNTRDEEYLNNIITGVEKYIKQ